MLCDTKSSGPKTVRVVDEDGQVTERGELEMPGVGKSSPL